MTEMLLPLAHLIARSAELKKRLIVEIRAEMRKRSRKDGNHNELVKVFEQLGCSVAQLHAVGIPGFPDLVVGCMGSNRLVECKSNATAYGRAGLNANQSAFNRDWRGERMYTVSSPDEVIALVTNWRKAK
jgi:hypothetical protein